MNTSPKALLLSAILLVKLEAFSQSKDEIKNIAIFLQDNVEILDFAGPMEVLIIAGFNVYTVAETTDPIIAMHSLKVVPDYSIENAPTPDIMIFVGGGDIAAAKKENIKSWVEEVVPKTKLQLTVCTGVFFLAEIGRLDDMVATTYHNSISYLRSSFPKIDVRGDVRFVDNGEVITTAGISAGIDGSLHLVSKLKGKKEAERVARAMEYDKWVPEEGLITSSIEMEEIERVGIEGYLKTEKGARLYAGELLNIAQALNENGNHKEAEKAIRFVINKSNNPGIEVYGYLRENFLKQGKTVPMTSADFTQLIKEEGVAVAEDTFNDHTRKFDKWVFVDPDDIIMLGYTDYFLQGDRKTAFEIQNLARKMFPEDAYVTYVLGVYHEKEGQTKQALELYHESLQYDPNFAMSKDKINALKKAGKI